MNNEHPFGCHGWKRAKTAQFWEQKMANND
jgi:hypothetical protein